MAERPPEEGTWNLPRGCRQCLCLPAALSADGELQVHLQGSEARTGSTLGRELGAVIMMNCISTWRLMLLSKTQPCLFLPEGLPSFSSQKNLRPAPAHSPASAACSKVSPGPSVSWWTFCSRTRPSSLCSVSLFELTQTLVAPGQPEQTPLPLPPESLKRLTGRNRVVHAGQWA